MGYVAKLKKAREKTITTEKLDYQPLAIIANARKPETMSEAIARILDHSLKNEEWERIRGVEYDYQGDEIGDDDGEGDFDSGTAEHDDKGYFDDNQKKGGNPNANGKQKIPNNAVDNGDNGSDRDNLGMSKEPTLKSESNADEN